MPSLEFEIDRSKKFKTLPNAPIVEAVLHWHAAASSRFDENQLPEILRDSFPDYDVRSQHNLEAAITESPKGVEFRQSANWEGVRLTKSEEGKPAFVCQFRHEGIVFSRLAPYRGWGEFRPEALKFWEKFLELGKPSEVARLSVRYISQIPIESVEDVREYIDVLAEPLGAIGVSSDRFFHQDTVHLKTIPYIINLIRAVQPSDALTETKKFLIVDIGAATSESIVDFELLPDKLEDLRFIKNHVFFTLLKNAEEKFGASQE